MWGFMNSYEEFLKKKKIIEVPTGIKEVPDLNPILFDYQKDIVKWALKRGRACIFADCGMGKTFMQLEWARVVQEYTGGSVLILAPLAVSEQTIAEAKKIDIDVERLVSDTFGNPGIYIVNYEQYHKYNHLTWDGIVLDESSILKSYTGKYRNEIIESTKNIAFRLACTATPAPNDFTELGNHAEFVGVATGYEMLSMFFINDAQNKNGEKWRLKKHAVSNFWGWVASWAVMITKPSDLGYSDEGFILPKLNMHQITVEAEKATTGFLFAMEAQTLQERQQARKSSIEDRAIKTANMVNSSTDIWLIWCNLNEESETLKRLIPGSVEVKGSDTDEHKKKSLLGFANGEIRVLISKPKIAGLGMNFQVCHKMAFVGLSDSYEQFYQSVRRCWRFGQKDDVDCYMITSELEGAVVKNIERKEGQAKIMTDEMVKNMKDINADNIKGIEREFVDYKENYYKGDNWEAYHGDSCEILQKLPDNHVGYYIFSPPFSALYTFSNSDRDLSNCKDDNEFYEHFKFIIKELYRTLKPGRNLSFHVMNTTLQKARDGVLGVKDLRGDMIRLFQEAGFIYHSEVCIWKDPGLAMIRTKHIGLLHKQVKKDSCVSRQGLADYLVTMSKPGENMEPVSGLLDHYVGTNDIKKRDSEEFQSVEIWNKYASPVWMDIDPSDTLQYRSARDEADEKHMTPTQLQVIHRGIQLWSNPGDVVASPFGGIGSEGYEAVKMGRKAILIELKDSYFKQLVNNMKNAESDLKHDMLDLDI